MSVHVYVHASVKGSGHVLVCVCVCVCVCVQKSVKGGLIKRGFFMCVPRRHAGWRNGSGDVWSHPLTEHHVRELSSIASSCMGVLAVALQSPTTTTARIKEKKKSR